MLAGDMLDPQPVVLDAHGRDPRDVDAPVSERLPRNFRVMIWLAGTLVGLLLSTLLFLANDGRAPLKVGIQGLLGVPLIAALSVTSIRWVGRWGPLGYVLPVLIALWLGAHSGSIAIE